MRGPLGSRLLWDQRGDRLRGAVTAAALFKALLGAIGLVAVAGATDPIIPKSVYLLVLVVFAATGGVLFFGGRSDRRARDLGTFYVLVATVYADLGLAELSAGPMGVRTLAYVLHDVRLDALAPAVLWSFAGSFPRAPLFGSGRRTWEMCGRAAFGVGAALMVLNLAAVPMTWSGELPSGPLAWFYRHKARSLYWPTILGLIVAAIVFGSVRYHFARVEERRRARLLLSAIAAGAAPLTSIVVLGALVPDFGAWSTSPATARVLAWIIYPGLLAVPVATGFAVVVDRALDVRLVVRRAVQYGLARGTLLFGMALPAVILLITGYRHRNETLVAFVSGPRAVSTLGLIVAAWLTHRFRASLFDMLDRAFFRYQFDARQILTGVAKASKGPMSVARLASTVIGEVDRAFHVSSVHWMTLDHRSELLVAEGASVRTLAPSSPLAETVRASGGPLSVDWRPGSWTETLPDSDVLWLSDSGASLIQGFLGFDGTLIGLLLMGEKRSELPFTDEDKELIEAVSAPVGLALDRLLAADSTPSGSLVRPRPPTDAMGTTAHECTDCGRVAASAGPCEECAAPARPAPLPLFLGGRYRLQRRIGQGGMGVVFRALDIELGREVAIKTLPRVSPTHSRQLRREARAMATLSHNHLAAIFDYESWNGAPVLVFEFLEGGALSTRLKTDGPLAEDETVTLGLAIASALDTMHGDLMLHRDVKPSNIGFSRHGTPKLMDFGVAEAVDGPVSLTGRRGQVAGTLSYLSPEAIDGRAADPSQDLWALAVTLYECLTGSNPFQGRSPAATLKKIGLSSPPRLSGEVADASPALEDFFVAALSRNVRERPRSAQQFIRSLEAIRAPSVFVE